MNRLYSPTKSRFKKMCVKINLVLKIIALLIFIFNLIIFIFYLLILERSWWCYQNLLAFKISFIWIFVIIWNRFKTFLRIYFCIRIIVWISLNLTFIIMNLYGGIMFIKLSLRRIFRTDYFCEWIFNHLI